MIDIEVLHPGLLTSIQDDGRRGVAFYGIPASGHLDPVAAHKANALLGNTRSTPVIECNLLAPKLRFVHSAIFSVTGANMQWTLDDRLLTRNTAIRAPAGAILSGAYAIDGARAYVAVGGTIECQRDHESAATYTYAALGGLDGRALEKGDVIHVVPHAETAIVTASTGSAAVELCESAPSYDAQTKIQFEPGPEWSFLSQEAQRLFTSAEFVISMNSNRMGARLDGPTLVTRSPAQMETVPLLPGTVQLPGSRLPIVILADGQTTGGYPRIAIIPESELARFNQIRPGLPFGFQYL